MPPPIIYKHQDAARVGARKDFDNRVRMTDDGLYILEHLVRIVTWPIRAFIGLVRAEWIIRLHALLARDLGG